MTSFRRVFVLLVVAFATGTKPAFVFKPLNDLFTGHSHSIPIHTHLVKEMKDISSQAYSFMSIVAGKVFPIPSLGFLRRGTQFLTTHSYQSATPVQSDCRITRAFKFEASKDSLNQATLFAPR